MDVDVGWDCNLGGIEVRQLFVLDNTLIEFAALASLYQDLPLLP